MIDHGIVVGLCWVFYLHLIYAFRNRNAFARANVNALKRISNFDTDSIVIAWAVGVDIIIVIVFFLPP
jgi:hypothetical protein